MFDQKRLAEAEQIGMRLASELAALVQAAPATDRTARTLAQHLDIDRNICQKIMAGSQAGISGIEALLRVPGTRSLYVLIEAAKGRKFPKPLLQSLTLSVDRFAEFLAQTTETQQGLREAVAKAERNANTDPQDARRRMFEASVDLIGLETAAQITVWLSRPVPENPDQVETMQVATTIGRRSHAGWATLTIQSYLDDKNHMPAPGLLPDEEAVLIEKFSTQPLVIKKEPPEDAPVYIIDPVSANGRAIDVVTITRLSPIHHPRFYEPPLLRNMVSPVTPVRRMIIDHVLHRSMARESVGSFTALRWGGKLPEDPRREWHRRLPGTHALQVLGPASEAMNIPVEAWPRLGELMRYIFDLLGWRAEEFITHRAEVEYPVCGASYHTIFDFSTHEPS